MTVLVGCSCNKEPLTYSVRDMYYMGTNIEPTLEEVGISNNEPGRRVLCSNYGEGCVVGSGKRVKVRKVEMLVIMFKDEKSARKEARRIGQWYAKNWLLDDVTNEPVLESFVQEAFKAKPGLNKNEIKK